MIDSWMHPACWPSARAKLAGLPEPGVCRLALGNLVPEEIGQPLQIGGFGGSENVTNGLICIWKEKFDGNQDRKSDLRRSTEEKGSWQSRKQNTCGLEPVEKHLSAAQLHNNFPK